MGRSAVSLRQTDNANLDHDNPPRAVAFLGFFEMPARARGGHQRSQDYEAQGAFVADGAARRQGPLITRPIRGISAAVQGSSG
jgi:hypothetical protein